MNPGTATALKDPVNRERALTLSDLALMATLLFAMVGNATISGVDVTLAAIFPVCLIALLLKNPAYSRSGTLVALAITAVGLVMSYQASRLGNPDEYGLWPLKAVLLAVFIQAFQKPVKGVHFAFLFALVLIFAVTSEDVYGRSYGLFGPNMLYRFYGMLFALACYLLVTGQVSRAMCGLAMAIAVIGIVRTGSVGGLFLLVFGVALLLRPSFRTVTVLAILSLLIWWFSSTIVDLNVVQRLLVKATIEDASGSSRFQGIVQLLSYDITVLGRPREAYASAWRLYYEYPHNIFVELIVFFGYVGVALCGLLVWALWQSFRRIREERCSLFDFAFFAVFFGASLSGDLSDNYATIGFAFALLAAHAGGRRRDAASGDVSVDATAATGPR